MSGQDRDDPEFLLITVKDRAGPSVVAVGVAVAVLGATALIVVTLHDVSGLGRGIMAVVIGGVCFAMFWIIGAHVPILVRWAYWRRRHVPALRLTAGGLYYSAAHTGTFSLHVPWTMVEGSAYRPDEGGHLFWCVDIHPTVIIEILSANALLRPVHPDHARATAIRLVRTAARHGDTLDVDLLTHTLAFGTPVAINLHRVHTVPLAEVDTAVVRWSGGKCTLMAEAPVSPDDAPPGPV